MPTGVADARGQVEALAMPVDSWHYEAAEAPRGTEAALLVGPADLPQHGTCSQTLQVRSEYAHTDIYTRTCICTHTRIYKYIHMFKYIYIVLTFEAVVPPVGDVVGAAPAEALDARRVADPHAALRVHLAPEAEEHAWGGGGYQFCLLISVSIS